MIALSRYALDNIISIKAHHSQAIRSAKSQLRDSQVLRIERFPRFSNISATLLHVGMININSDQEELRSAAYDLLGAVCSYLDYEKHPIIASKGEFDCAVLSSHSYITSS